MSDRVMKAVGSGYNEMRCQVCGRKQIAKFDLSGKLLPESQKCQRGCRISVGKDGQAAGIQRSSRRSRGPGVNVYV